MSRERLDDNTLRKPVLETGQYYKVETLAISAAIVLSEGMPPIIALDPASTGRNVTMFTPAVPSLAQDIEIINISSGTGVLSLLQADGATAAGSLSPGQRAWGYWNPKTALWQFYTGTLPGSQTSASQLTFQQYTTLAGLANAQLLVMAVPFAFKLLSVGFRTKIAASTASKLATLTGQINGVSVTGGVISLTTANQNTSGALTAGTSITAGNVGAAGQSVGVVVSAVTAFVEGDGYVEYSLLNTSLLA